jgi:hypothetical protein
VGVIAPSVPSVEDPLTSNTFWDWETDHAFMAVPAQVIVGQFLSTFKEYPPQQKAASFTIDEVLESLQQPHHGSN